MTAKKKPEEKEEPYRPMGVQPPSDNDRIDAVMAEMKVIKDWINRHNRQHYGKDAV